MTSDADKVTIPNPATGLVLYNTNNGTNVDANYLYWWDGTKWIRPITDVQTAGTTPPAEIVWEFSAPATAPQFSEIEMSRTYAAGPFTVPTSGWYQLNFRTYFEVAFTSSVDPLAIPMAQMIFTVNTNNTVTDGTIPATDNGQLFDSRFNISKAASNPSGSPFLYLSGGKNYYMKYVAFPRITPSGNIKASISKERKVILKQFK